MLILFIPAVTVQMLQSFTKLFLSRLHLEALLHGNMTRQLALNLITEVEALLVNSQPLLPSQQLLLREVKLPAGRLTVYLVNVDLDLGIIFL